MSTTTFLSTKSARLVGVVACVAAVGVTATLASGLFAGGSSRAHAVGPFGGRYGEPLELLEGDQDGLASGSAEREDGFKLAARGKPGSRTQGSRGVNGTNGTGESPAARNGAEPNEAQQAEVGSGRAVRGEDLGNVGDTRGRRGAGPTSLLAGGEAVGTTQAANAGLVPGGSDASNPGKTTANDWTTTVGNGDPAAAPYCGDNIVQGSECEPPNTPLCSDDCTEVTDLACFDCEQAGDCWEFSETCLADNFGPEQQSLCYDVQECVKDSDCADGRKPLAACFCGNLSTAACMAAPIAGPSAPVGACADVIRMAMGGPSMTNGQVLSRLINIAFPAGAALARMNCEKLSPACSSVCGF